VYQIVKLTEKLQILKGGSMLGERNYGATRDLEPKNQPAEGKLLCEYGLRRL